MNRLWLYILCLLMLSTAPVHAASSDQLGARLCTFGSDLTSGLDEARAITANYDCGSNKFTNRSDRVWVRADMQDSPFRTGKLELQSDNAALDAMHIYALFEDGQISSLSYDRADIGLNWRPKGLFGVPVPSHPAAKAGEATDAPKLNQLFVAVDRPWSPANISLIQILPADAADTKHLSLMVMFALLTGMSLVPVLYSVFFFGALRYKFMLWHSILALSAAIYMFNSSGLIFIAWPSVPLGLRMDINYWSMAIGMLASGFFTIHYLEKGMLSKRTRQVIIFSSLLLLISTFLSLYGGEFVRLRGRSLYHMAFLPCIAASIWAIVVALRKGSRSARFQIASWIPITLFGIDRIGRGTGLYLGFHELDYGLYFTLVFETTIIALGVADRMLMLRREHEEGMLNQIELTKLAETDGLTALTNRRGFEAEFDECPTSGRFTQLAIFDIDHFKEINDTFGHECGDNVLREIGRVLNKSGLYAARIGGEEFALLLTSKKNGHISANLPALFRKLTKTIHSKVPVLDRPVTFSAGVAPIFPEIPSRVAYALADQRLYQAKNAGRNQIIGVLGSVVAKIA